MRNTVRFRSARVLGCQENFHNIFLKNKGKNRIKTVEKVLWVW